MKRLLTILIITLFISQLLATPSNAAISPWDISKNMGLGTNLGNTLEPPYEAGWNAKEAMEYYFDDYKAIGYKHVRIPVRWDCHTSKTYPYEIDKAFLDRVEEVVDWSLSRGFITVINSHHDDWIMEDYDNNIERFEKIWEQISERFKNKSENLMFEILNEPHGNITDQQVADMNQRILAKIRVNNPTRITIIGAGYWNSWRATIYSLKIPNDNCLMATFHYYEPIEFTHDLTRNWGSKSDMEDTKKAFDSMKDWSVKNNIPVYLGEFGVKLDADKDSRLLWYDYVSDLAATRGIPATIWDDEGWFKVYDRTNRTFDTEILDKVFNLGSFDIPTPTPKPMITVSPTPTPVYESGEKIIDEFNNKNWGAFSGNGATCECFGATAKDGSGLVVNYTGSTNGYWGVSSGVWSDWSNWKKVSLDLKADSETYIRIILTEKTASTGTEGEKWSYTIKTATEWKTYELSLSDFTKRLDYQPAGEDGSNTLELNNLCNIQIINSNSNSGSFTIDNLKLIGLPPAIITPTPDEIIYGDVSGDGFVDSSDYYLLRRYLLDIISELPAENWKTTGDVNMDGVIDSGDYLLLRRYLLGIIQKFN